MELSASQVRSLILDEHTVIRDVLEEIDETLGELTRRVPGALGRLRSSLRTLHDAFLRHLTHEEIILRPILVDVDAWGPARVQAMDEEHRGQRAAMAELSRLVELYAGTRRGTTLSRMLKSRKRARFGATPTS